jgi:hypothetical protein
MMATPLEGEILNGFRQRLEEAAAISDALVDELVTLAASVAAPSPQSLLGVIKSNTGEQPV